MAERAEPARANRRRTRFTVDALFTDTRARGVGVNDLVDAKLIRLDRVQPDPEQPRRTFDEQSLEELASSIRAEGILQPIAVRYEPDADVYVIVHGERRWRAANLVGLSEIPALVRDVPQERRLIQQLMENVVREDLNALDRAAALRQLKAQMDDAPWDKVAEAVGIRRSRLFQLLGTEKLEAPLQEALRRGMVSEKQTRALQQLPAETQQDLGNRILNGSLSGRSIDLAAEAHKASGGSSRPVPKSRADDPLASARSTELLRAAGRQARALAGTLTEVRTLDLSLSDRRFATELAADLRALQQQLDDALDHLESSRS